jgi:hypothetical protein
VHCALYGFASTFAVFTSPLFFFGIILSLSVMKQTIISELRPGKIGFNRMPSNIFGNQLSFQLPCWHL